MKMRDLRAHQTHENLGKTVNDVNRRLKSRDDLR